MNIPRGACVEVSMPNGVARGNEFSGLGVGDGAFFRGYTKREGEGEVRRLPSWVPDWRPGSLCSFLLRD